MEQRKARRFHGRRHGKLVGKKTLALTHALEEKSPHFLGGLGHIPFSSSANSHVI
jgi:hypothetical protein